MKSKTQNQEPVYFINPSHDQDRIAEEEQQGKEAFFRTATVSIMVVLLLIGIGLLWEYFQKNLSSPIP